MNGLCYWLGGLLTGWAIRGLRDTWRANREMRLIHSTIARIRETALDAKLDTMARTGRWPVGRVQ